MGKLVLGILAVVLLQLVFFGYTSIYWSTPNEATVVKSRATPPPGIVRPEPSPQSLALTPPTSESVPLVKSDKIENPRMVAGASTRVSSHSGVRRRPTRNPVKPSQNGEIASMRISRETRPTFLIPKGHTMVLVDKLPPTRDTRIAEKSASRNRSFLAKSFSVVVKKPWSWMKSLASKLN